MVAFTFLQLVLVAASTAFLAVGPALADTPRAWRPHAAANGRAAEPRSLRLPLARREYHYDSVLNPRSTYYSTGDGDKLQQRSQMLSRRGVVAYDVGDIVAELEARGCFPGLKEKFGKKVKSWKADRAEKKVKEAEKKALKLKDEPKQVSDSWLVRNIKSWRAGGAKKKSRDADGQEDPWKDADLGILQGCTLVRTEEDVLKALEKQRLRELAQKEKKEKEEKEKEEKEKRERDAQIGKAKQKKPVKEAEKPKIEKTTQAAEGQTKEEKATEMPEKAKIMKEPKAVDTMKSAVEVKQNEAKQEVVGVDKPKRKVEEKETGEKNEAVEMVEISKKGSAPKKLAKGGKAEKAEDRPTHQRVVPIQNRPPQGKGNSVSPEELEKKTDSQKELFTCDGCGGKHERKDMVRGRRKLLCVECYDRGLKS